jgi:hypothetical protein
MKINKKNIPDVINIIFITIIIILSIIIEIYRKKYNESLLKNNFKTLPIFDILIIIIGILFLIITIIFIYYKLSLIYINILFNIIIIILSSIIIKNKKKYTKLIINCYICKLIISIFGIINNTLIRIFI